MVYYGLLLFFVLEYIRPGSYVPALIALHLNSIVPLTALLGSIFTKRVKVPEVLGSPNARWILFLLALMVISGFTCDVKLYALNVFENVVGYFFMFFILKKEIYDLDRIKGVLTTLILVHLAVGALTPDLFSGDGERHYIASGSFLGDGNDFSLSVSIVIPFCIFLMLAAQSVTKKLFYLGALGILIFSVVATQSRGAMIGVACMGFYYWLKSDRKILGIVGIVLVIVFIGFVAPSTFFDRMETITTDEAEMEGSALGRVLAWKASIRMVEDHPLLGVGVGHFPVKYGAEYRPPVEYGKIPWQTAHSSYFLILGELGVPGIIFLVGIIISNLVASERTLRQINMRSTDRDGTSRNLVIALNASLISFAVGGAFLSATYYPHIFLLTALLECGRDIYRKSLVAGAVADKSDEDVPQSYRGLAV